jgi:hypothetical protein
MNTSLSVNSIHPAKSQPAFSANIPDLPFIARLLHSIELFVIKPVDDPAALRYIAGKYPGEID